MGLPRTLALLCLLLEGEARQRKGYQQALAVYAPCMPAPPPPLLLTVYRPAPSAQAFSRSPCTSPVSPKDSFGSYPHNHRGMRQLQPPLAATVTYHEGVPIGWEECAC